MPADARSLLRASLNGKKDGRESLPSVSKRKIALQSEGDNDDVKDPKRRRNSVERQTDDDESGKDEEWLRFQKEVLLAPDQQDTAVINMPNTGSKYKDATFHALPVLNSRVRKGDTQDTPVNQENTPGDAQVKVDDGTLERTEFLARLEEEERMQEDSMLRVQALKKRLASLKNHRHTKQSGK